MCLNCNEAILLRLGGDTRESGAAPATVIEAVAPPLQSADHDRRIVNELRARSRIVINFYSPTQVAISQTTTVAGREEQFADVLLFLRFLFHQYDKIRNSEFVGESAQLLHNLGDRTYAFLAEEAAHDVQFVPRSKARPFRTFTLDCRIDMANASIGLDVKAQGFSLFDKKKDAFILMSTFVLLRYLALKWRLDEDFVNRLKLATKIGSASILNGVHLREPHPKLSFLLASLAMFSHEQ